CEVGPDGSFRRWRSPPLHAVAHRRTPPKSARNRSRARAKPSPAARRAPCRPRVAVFAARKIALVRATELGAPGQLAQVRAFALPAPPSNGPAAPPTSRGTARALRRAPGGRGAAVWGERPYCTRPGAALSIER